MTGRRRALILGAAIYLLAAACSDATGPGPPVPTTIELDHDSVSLVALGRTQQVTATVLDQTGAAMGSVALAWASNAPAVATVTSSGLVTAVGNGTAVVSVSAGAANGQLQVRVAQAAGTVLVQPDSVVFDDPGDAAQLTVGVQDADGSAIVSPQVVWSSTDAGVVTVDATGRIEAVGTGTAVVTAEVDGVAGAVGVRVAPELTVVAASATGLVDAVDASVPLTVRVEDLLGGAYAGALVTWSADAGSGAIVSAAASRSDPTGHSTALWRLGTVAGPQSARARITSRGNVVEVIFQASAQPGPAVSATLVADSVLLSARGETAYLSPTYADAYGNLTAAGGLTWASRDASVATVATDGLVTGQAAGATYVVGSIGAAVDSLLVTVVMRGAITVTFDDGFDEMYDNAFPVFQQLGLRGNVAVNPGQVGFPAYMSESELDEVHAAGFSIVSHTMTHDSLTSVSAGELDWQLRASQEWIEAKGYRGGNVFIVPFHDWSLRERNAIAGYYEATRGTSATVVVPDSIVPWKPLNPYELTGIEADLLPYTTTAGRDRLRTLLQRTSDEGRFVDVFFHHLPAANVAAFQATLAVVDEFRERVLPYHELYPRFARGVY